MPIYVRTNVPALTAQNNLSKVQSSITTSFQRLSSGYRINTAADDAGALGISDNMTAQIRSYAVAERNANDGISMAQTADGAAAQITDILQRMRELSVQAANGSYSTSDRGNLDTEFQALRDEIDRISKVSKFNGTDLLQASQSIDFQVGIMNSAVDVISVSFGGITLGGLGIATVDVLSVPDAKTSIDSIDTAIQALANRRAKFGAAMNRLQYSINNIQSMKTNLSAANSRIKDVDVAEESSQLSRQQIISQGAAAILSQANQQPQLALNLLKG